MGLSLNDILAKIASNVDFLKSAGDNFGKNEKIEALFISGGEKGDTLVLQDTTQDNYTVSAQSVKNILTDEEFDVLMNGGKVIDEKDLDNEIPVLIGNTAEADKAANVGNVANVENVNAVDEAANVAATGKSAEIQKEIESLKRQKAANQESMVSLQNQIAELKEKVQQAITEALDAIEDAKEEQKDIADRTAKEKIDEFQKRIENGEEISPAQLSQGVANAIEAQGLPASYQNAVSKLLFADTNAQLMSSLLGQLGEKIQIDRNFDSQIATKEEAYKEAKAAEEAAARAAQNKSCDPIGFQMDGMQFDFFYDKDNDGKINAINDFVGAEGNKTGDGFDEISNLDGTNGGKNDGQITSEELIGAGMKVMVTDKDGKQYPLSIEEFEAKFGKIEINKNDVENGQAGFNGNVGPKNFGDDAGNQLLSSFSLKVGGRELTGYQTNDTHDWLIDNYGSVMDMEGVEKSIAAEQAGAAEGAEGEPNEFEKFVQEYTDNVMPELQKQIDDAYDELETIGFSGEFRMSVKNLAKTSAEAEATKIKTEHENEEKKAIEEAEEEEALNEPPEAEDEEEVDPDKKPEEEE